MRVLHLIDAASPQASPTTFALLGDSLGRLGHTGQEVLLLGGGPLAGAAKAGGIAHAQRLGVPFGRAVLGWPSLRRTARSLGVFDLIHCWSVGAMAVAGLVWPRIPRALTLTVPPSPSTARWLRILTRETAGRTILLPISATVRAAALSAGLDPELVHTLRPGLDMAKVQPNRRAELRAGWGIDDADAQSGRIRVVALLCDPPAAGDAEVAHMAVGLADESYALRAGGREPDAPVLWMLVHPDQLHRARTERTARDLGRLERIIQEPALARPWDVLPGCDLALAQGPHAGGLSMLWAMAANVPIVAEATYAISEVVEDRHSALLAKPDQPRMLAGRITQLLADPQLAWKLRDTARHEAFSYFSRQRYCHSLQGVYEQLVGGRAVEIPQIPITGGLRFSGRA